MPLCDSPERCRRPLCRFFFCRSLTNFQLPLVRSRTLFSGPPFFFLFWPPSLFFSTTPCLLVFADLRCDPFPLTPLKISPSSPKSSSFQVLFFLDHGRVAGFFFPFLPAFSPFGVTTGSTSGAEVMSLSSPVFFSLVRTPMNRASAGRPDPCSASISDPLRRSPESATFSSFGIFFDESPFLRPFCAFSFPPDNWFVDFFFPSRIFSFADSFLTVPSVRCSDF